MRDLLASLDISKSSGNDGISTRMLKSTACNIAPSFTKLLNLSLQLNAIPSTWKKALVVPLPTNTDLTNPVNYRPISLLLIVGKLLDWFKALEKGFEVCAVFFFKRLLILFLMYH